MGFGESGGDTARAVPPVREGQLGCVRCLQVDGFGEVACSALGDVIREAPVEPLLRAHAAKCGSMGPFRCGEFGGFTRSALQNEIDWVVRCASKLYMRGVGTDAKRITVLSVGRCGSMGSFRFGRVRRTTNIFTKTKSTGLLHIKFDDERKNTYSPF